MSNAATIDPYTAEKDFIDHLYQLFTKTSYAADSYWQPQEPDLFNNWTIWAVKENGTKEYVGEFLNEEDADFLTALHGGFPEFIRRFHAALDEAEQKDYDRDSRECRIAELEMIVEQWEMEGK